MIPVIVDFEQPPLPHRVRFRFLRETDIKDIIRPAIPRIKRNSRGGEQIAIALL